MTDLEPMWDALAKYQPYADQDGHGDSWRRMCSERTVKAAWYATEAAEAAQSSQRREEEAVAAARRLEERAEAEVTDLTGRTADGRIETIRVAAEGSPAANPAFDVTPARLVTGLITERGRCEASATGLRGLYPEAAG
jgi:hypothetical protein